MQVSWDQVFSPKKGVLGLKRVEDWNKVVTLKHIWNLFTQGGSLWVASVHEILLRAEAFGLKKLLRSAHGDGEMC